ncbi:MAG: dihydrolipoyl dehydrogenase [Magnetococcales bacterium]|nr:dihydrolipoyl dehydrogenase [Magnetococcales bacterium]NGZ04855.1 dihydrolipoyl dehydrogenase [Magnetococcales bacterium]
MSHTHFQVVVIGAGPGGYTAAFLAAGQGMRTLLVDPDLPGGVCLQRGCIPSKALLHAARIISESAQATHMGIHFPPPAIDLARLRTWKEEVVTRLTSGLAQQCQLRGVTRIQGMAHLLSSQHIRVESANSPPADITAERIILATGSTPTPLPGVDWHLPGVMDSTRALALETIPASLLVIGGGNIGLELGSVYAALGSRVCLIEAADGILPGADRDLVRPLAARLTKIFASIQTATRVIGVEPLTRDRLRVQVEDQTGQQTTHEVERLLVATGRIPMCAIPGLDATQVTCNAHGAIEVDAGMRTADPAILAIGDVTGGPMLAHKAAAQARIAVATLMGEPPPRRFPILPGVTYTDPEVAWAGLTETQARQQGIPVRAVRFPWAASGRAHTLERTEGVTKWILEPDTGRILGVGICGVGAGELISEGVLAMEQGLIIQDVAHTVHPHPSLSETLMESAEIFFGQCIHFHAPPRR